MQRTRNTTHNQVRIIGGTFRSRKLTFPTIPSLRPTGNRIRETLFNWLTPNLAGSRCLDLFAGSGALGIEALSRGAEHVTFIDISTQACESICANLDLLNRDLLTSGRARVVCTNSLLWLDKQHIESETDFAIAFLDPPFDANIIDVCCSKLESSDTLASNSLIYVEVSRENKQCSPPPVNWQRNKHQLTGGVCYQLFQRK